MYIIYDMIYCFAADEGAKIALHNLMKSGMYKDISEAICVSLINHDVIQREAQHNGGLEITQTQLLDKRSAFVQGTAIATSVSGKQFTAGNLGIPAVFQLPDSISADEFPDIPADHSPRHPPGPKQWFFGQFNKILALKAATRAVLNLIGPDRGGISLDDAVHTIAAQSQALGDFLAGIDKRHGTIRENALATAFPTTQGSGNAGQARFVDQFVISVNSAGLADGFPVRLRLLLYIDGKIPRINLSRPGAQFALLKNPVLDEGIFEQGKLSAEEISFLVSHIKTHVPEEWTALQIVLRGLTAGAVTPADLDEFLRAEFPERDMSTAFLSLQRSGVISRLIDLQMVERIREGTRVKYSVTKTGNTVVAEVHETDAEMGTKCEGPTNE